jgi:hypothetical protein
MQLQSQTANQSQKSSAKLCILTHKNGAVSLYRLTEDNPAIAPDVFRTNYTTSIFYKETVSLPQLRQRVDMINAKLTVRKLSLNDVNNFVFYKEANDIAILDLQKKVTSL